MRKFKQPWYRSSYAQILIVFLSISAIQFLGSLAFNWTKNAEREKAFVECTESAIPDFACILMRK